MPSKKQRVLVVCPGRGSYTKETLGYLKFFQPEIAPFLTSMDDKRQQSGLPTLSDMDSSAEFKTKMHTKGEHASTLIYACSYADFMSLDRDKYEVVAISGNSMGWYSTLALSKVLSWDGAYLLIQTMGSMMREKIIGGQIIYPIVDDHWKINLGAKEKTIKAIEEVNEKGIGQAYISIELGGYLVIGGDQPALSHLLKALPQIDPYPFQLVNHGAFHTPLLEEVSKKAFSVLTDDIFNRPQTPIIDGRGKIWSTYSTDPTELYEYTLGHQVTCPYNFTDAISVGLKEFAPDKVILLGPGNTLGGTIGQIMIQNDWMSLKNKEDFTNQQKNDPLLISMGLPGVREQGHSVPVNIHV